MNKERRDKIDKVRIAMTKLREDIEGIAEEEREAVDNLPENLLGSPQAEEMDGAAEALEEAATDLINVDDCLGFAYDKGNQ